MDGDGRDNPGRSGWSELDDNSLQVIASRSNPLSMSRLSACVLDLRISLERVALGRPLCFPYDLPCLLHQSCACTIPEKGIDPPRKVMDASMLPLDRPSIPAPIIFPELAGCGYWASYRRNWVAMFGSNGTGTSNLQCYLFNLYIDTSIRVPSFENAGFREAPSGSSLL